MESKHISSDTAQAPMNSLTLLLLFIRIGCFTFGGGWSIVAQIEQEFIEKRHLITKAELLEMVAVGKSMPGIMITNICMLFGYHVCGIPGGIFAVLGITVPPVLILSFVAIFYNSFKSNYWVHAALTGIRAAVIPIIASSALSLGKEALQTRTAILIFAAALAAVLFTDISNVALVLIAVLSALVLFSARELAFSGKSGK